MNVTDGPSSLCSNASGELVKAAFGALAAKSDGYAHERLANALVPFTVAGRTLTGEWRVSNDGIFCGTIRVAKFDFDTDPSEDFKQAIYLQMFAALNGLGADDMQDKQTYPPG